MKNFEEIRPGVLNQEQILTLNEDVIEKLNDKGVDPSAFDLHLSRQGWKMKGSIKASSDTTIDKIIGDYSEEPLTNGGPWILQRGKTYIFRLREYLKLADKSMVFGKATGKSSIGRLDVLTRLMVNNCPSFDTIENDSYKGSLYLEVTPITFPIQVREGVALSQLRLFRGSPESSELRDDQLPLYPQMILKEDGKPKTEKVRELRVNLDPDENGNSAFMAQKMAGKDLVVDLTREEKFDPEKFWAAKPPAANGTLEIEPEQFYILRSKERFKLPEDVAVYCEAISETLGELRIHYAGFVHPGFGRDRDVGTPVIFEVRGHNVSVFLRDGETLAHIKFYRMSKPCSEECLKTKKSGYEEQELKLSKYFKDWA
ncbi:MAG: 2'-deoxycytidine 5'-triphosphate deaminase [candidate division Zixibacteria bacterium]|nr:2'-deoxycytidine 5'-triphosphate deaminase [candidate division Zixibacteria bacterium]